MRGEYVAPADHFSVSQRNEVAKIVCDDVAIELERLLGGRCSKECQVTPLASNEVEHEPQCVEVRFSEWDDFGAHGAQREAPRRLWRSAEEAGGLTGHELPGIVRLFCTYSAIRDRTRQSIRLGFNGQVIRNFAAIDFHYAASAQ